MGVLLALVAAPVAAQERIPSDCVLLSQFPAEPERVVPAGFRDPLASDAVRISFGDHAMLLIQARGASGNVRPSPTSTGIWASLTSPRT